MPDAVPTEDILGIRFVAGTAAEAVAQGMRPGLVVAPAAPALILIPQEPDYYAALKCANTVLPDSGLMVLVWRLLTGSRIKRVSGLHYLKRLLMEPELRPEGATFWIMPDESASRRNRDWLNANGIRVSESNCYVAPMYGPGAIEDFELADRIRHSAPRHIIVAIAGGVQERLGHFLHEKFPGASIHCIGAAIGFLSGNQAPIPMWVDRIYAGWLLRCLFAPHRFIPRYVKSVRLVALMLRYRSRAPQDE